MHFEKSLNFVMVADHVEIEQPAIGREDQSCGKSMPTFIESFPERSDAASAMGMWIAKGIAHRLDQFADLFPLRLRESTQSRQQIGIELNL